jgi:hypothetical protein
MTRNRDSHVLPVASPAREKTVPSGRGVTSLVPISHWLAESRCRKTEYTKSNSGGLGTVW